MNFKPKTVGRVSLWRNPTGRSQVGALWRESVELRGAFMPFRVNPTYELAQRFAFVWRFFDNPLRTRNRADT